MSTSSRLVRGAKTRMFAFISLVCVLGAVLFLFHGTQIKLADVQKQIDTCLQQKESFHAQLQVIFEYKERLENSLNKEKTEHKQTKDNYERKLKEDKEQIENDYSNKNDILQQRNNNLQGQLEELKESYEKIQDEKTRLAVEIETIKKELEASKVKNDEDIENMKTDWLKKHEECRSLEKELEKYKMKALPETDRNNYLEKQNFQIKEENEKIKEELAECKLGKEKKTGSNGKSEAAEVEEVKKVGPLIKLFSSTPGINPEALLGGSSAKPPPKDEISRKDEQAAVASAPKKPTQESVVPLAQPGKIDENLGAGQGQIPQPPNPPNPHSNILPKPNVEDNQELNNINLPEDSEDNLIKQQQDKAQLQEPNVFIPDANRAEEEEEVAQFKQPGKNAENYRAGDYDKEQPEEEDEEGELIDDDGDRSIKDAKGKMKIPPQVRMIQQRNSGVMVNPK